ncbi:type II secretion system protein GspM [Pantoea stewartii]|uniref:type II secretion system protein GspM n=1 Tax=Pantoea stewartii TaxID=66269 RepID=UPI0016258095|nr:type II secretion system protein M [Pantoea stewartii]
MSSLTGHWMRLAPPLRYGSLLAGAICLLCVAWWTVLQPQKRVLADARHQCVQQQAHLQQLQRQFARYPALAVLQAQLQQIQMEKPAASSTLEAIIAERGAALEQWLPDEQPRALTFHLQWAQFPPLFSALSTSATAFPDRFQLTAHSDYLVAQLWLDADETL